MWLDIIGVSVNGVHIGSAFPEGFFHKYGNSDGQDIIGLVAESYFVRKLWSLGYEVRFVFSHNIEVRWITKGDFSHECVGDYGEVLEKMPGEPKTIIEEICREGLNISIEDDGEVPVYFKDKLLFKRDVKKLIYKIISKYRDGYITRGIIFDREFEPFLAALGMELIYMLDYRLKTSLHTLPTSKLEEVLNDVEKILSEKGIRLDEDIWTGLKIANDEELAGELRKISVSDKT
ncbi:MAG: hypothetical protein LZ173_02515 [Thaumarchaeota archaeon]|nr:hypothetical protein [Candidatus Geocrenenecus arthurdayi]